MTPYLHEFSENLPRDSSFGFQVLYGAELITLISAAFLLPCIPCMNITGAIKGKQSSPARLMVVLFTTHLSTWRRAQIEKCKFKKAVEGGRRFNVK